MKLPSSLKQSLESAAEKYATARTVEATSYLEGRGITEQVADTFLLGSVVDPAVGHDQYRGMLSIPYLTPTGVVGMKFRQLDDTARPKYLGLEGMESRMFNVNALHNHADRIAVCEGELDTIILDAVVGVPAVGVAGVGNWKKHHRAVLEGYAKIFVFADNDQKDDGSNPGHELAKRIIRDLPQAVLVGLPRGKDVNQTFLDDGPDALLELVNRP